MSQRRVLVPALIRAHFDPVPLDALTITQRRFPFRMRVDLQRAMEGLLDEERKLLHFSGVRRRYPQDGLDFPSLIASDLNNPVLSVPPEYEEIDVGESEPARCLRSGLWLLEQHQQPFAVLLAAAERHGCIIGIDVHVATTSDDTGTTIRQNFFAHLEHSVGESRSYRGKILSLEANDMYSGLSSGITVHRLPQITREQVILPSQTLEILDRNVIQFVRHRPQLSEFGLPTKKGVLFYGPPGTGKTHTIHYLATAMEENTTLLITAEQMAFLGEYMTLARLLQPSSVVIEDVDLIARARSQGPGGCEEALLNKLLNEMDGLREDAQILFILTTNRPETLEQALTSRPGRIDQAIEFPLPDRQGREKLIRLYSKGMDLPEDVVDATVGRTENVSGAFIKELMRRSAQFHLERADSPTITFQDITDALDELLFSGGSLNRKLLGGPLETDLEQRIVVASEPTTQPAT